MIQLISREEVFYKSSLVDHVISKRQRSWHDDTGYILTGYMDEKSIQAEDPYDHLDPFHNKSEVVDDFTVLGFLGKNKPDYIRHRSNAFIRFFELMEIKRLILVDELKCDWVHFPFSYREKREAFKSMIDKSVYNEAFIVDVEDLLMILPLFHFSGRHSTPVIWLFSAESKIPMALFLCDDANFHVSFCLSDRKKMTSAALDAGLIMGGLEVCMM